MPSLACPHCGRPLAVTLTRASQEPQAAPTPRRDDYHESYPTPRKPMTRERALRFAMPFGKYSGKTLRQIAEIDPTYLEWASENLDSGSATDSRG